ncbi:hypothetical protein ABZY02_32910 [Streptomyces sp. NPDC006649]|uniref:hypothetical protein n=1 Tax=Streptomyces sp. NPDC006649 TaxID=3156896 RepID=UPI0033B89466
MTVQPDHQAGRPGFTPPMGTLSELRRALSNWGFPGDRRQFEAELDALDLDDLSQMREVTQAYRHRVLLRYDPQGVAALDRSTEDVEDELQRKLLEAGA